MRTITQVVKNDLCTGCGTCVGICPQSALEMIKSEVKGIYVPKLHETRCTDCGICFKSCPGYSVNFSQLNKEFFSKEPTDILLGNSTKCYVGYATDHETRYNSASGGLVTALLTFALEEGMIDGALVTRMNKEKPLEPGPFIARTKNEIISASKSKYCPVAVCSALREIVKENGKFAVVGLPCHIHGVRKAETVNKRLREKIVLHFGIFCSHSPSFLATEFLLWKLGIEKENIVKIDYRGGGWPGGMSILLRSNNKIFIPYLHQLYYGGTFGSYFYPNRCTLCYDFSAELADISFGDAWNLSKNGMGVSLIISRDKAGDELLKKARAKGKIELEAVSTEKVIRSQEGSLYFKKDSLAERLFLMKIFGKKTPFYGFQFHKQHIDPANLIQSALFYRSIYVSSKRHQYLWNLLR